jgi:heme/copper-type cytochrome/quinol oxidase subunit 2
VRTVAVSYAGGQVSGTSGREEVPVGEQVVLRIASDVAEEVHVHGYDLQAAVPAGGSVDIPLTAAIPGVFEVELHDSGKVLFQLRVA